MPSQSSNTRDTMVCGECGMKCVGVETKVRLWYKLHYKKNHPDIKLEKLEMEHRTYSRPTRRGNEKAEYELKENTRNIPPSEIFAVK